MKKAFDRNSPLFDYGDYLRSCSSKKSYDSEWLARFAADECAMRQPGLRLSWYLCGYCGKWHLTERNGGR